MNRFLLPIVMAVLLYELPLRAEPIWINVSLKAIVDPATGKVPTVFSSNRLDIAFEQANIWLANNWRGYRLRVIDPYLFIGSTDTNGPSKWYNIDLKPDNNNRHAFDAVAQTDPRYDWNPNAVNMYINNGDFSSCSSALIISAYEIFRDQWHTNLFPYSVAGNWLHEIGHYFGLSHIFVGCDSNNPDRCFRTNGYWVAWCKLPDILPEQSGFNRDQITLANFNDYYTNCTPAEQVLANNTWFNLMSYHQITNTQAIPARQYNSQMNVITESQSDIWSDTANFTRAVSVSGLTRYVSPSGNDANGGWLSNAPKQHVFNAARSSSSGKDLVLVRPGTYNERGTLTNRTTIRATRVGWVSIGR